MTPRFPAAIRAPSYSITLPARPTIAEVPIWAGLLAAFVGIVVMIGWLLDKWLHTSPVLLAVFLLLGGAAGVANVWRLMGPGRQPPGERRL